MTEHTAPGTVQCLRLISSLVEEPSVEAKTKTIDEYLAALSDDKGKAPERLRTIIRVVAPRAEE